MKSFSIFYVGLEISLLLLLASVAPVVAKGGGKSAEDLTNFLLSPSYSRWLVGPISEIASAAVTG